MLPTLVDLLSPNIHLLSAHLIALPSIPHGRRRCIRTPQRPGWHQDMYGVAADLGQVSTPRLAVKVAHYLTEITADCGLTRFLPGSHRLTELPAIPLGGIDPPGAVSPDLGSTDVVLFENRTWHAGGLNTSGTPRLAFMLQYGYRWLAPVDDPATALRIPEGLTSIQRQLLGAPDRNPDGSLAKGRGAEPLRQWQDNRTGHASGLRAACRGSIRSQKQSADIPVKGFRSMSYQPDELFRSTAPYYARFRAGYPPEFFDYLAERFGLDGTQCVLDLGCGTGQVALPIAGLVRQVIAVDPEPTMLAEAARLAAEQAISNVDWRVGDSNRLAELALPPLDLATMGASFHWMDRDGVLRGLDRRIVEDGAVVVVSGGAPASSSPPGWTTVITEVRTRFLGPERRAGSATYSHPAEGHAEVLARSPFSHVDTVEWTRRTERDLDQVVGLQFSYSFSAPALLGDRTDAFETELRDALTQANPSGVFTQEIRTETLIGTRP